MSNKKIIVEIDYEKIPEFLDALTVKAYKLLGYVVILLVCVVLYKWAMGEL